MGAKSFMAFFVADTPFEGLDRRLRARVHKALVRRNYKKGDHLFLAGEDHRGLFWLRSGVALSYNGRGSAGYEFAAPVSWGLWGAPSILTGTHNSALEARSPCNVDWLPPEETQALMGEHGFVKLAAQWTADDYAMLLELLAVISISRSEDRLMGYLERVYRLALAKPDRRTGDHELSGIAWPFTTIQLAAFLALSRPHLSTIINRLSAENKVRIERKRLIIPGFASEETSQRPAKAQRGR